VITRTCGGATCCLAGICVDPTETYLYVMDYGVSCWCGQTALLQVVMGGKGICPASPFIVKQPEAAYCHWDAMGTLNSMQKGMHVWCLAFLQLTYLVLACTWLALECMCTLQSNAPPALGYAGVLPCFCSVSGDIASLAACPMQALVDC
jgi:hypothetical protein